MIDPDQIKSIMDSLDGMTLDGLEKGAKIEASIDSSRPLSEYLDASQVALKLKAYYEKRWVKTATLRKNGRAVQDKMDKYLRHPGISSHVLKAALKTPLHLFFERESGWKQELEKYEEEKSYFKLGSFIHEAILEPTKFSRVVVEPHEIRSTKSGLLNLCDFWAATILEKDGIERIHEIGNLLNQIPDPMKMSGIREKYRILKEQSNLHAITEKDFEIIRILKYNYFNYSDGILPELVKYSKREISLYGQCPRTGMDVKVRPDALQFKENIGMDAIISLKSYGGGGDLMHWMRDGIKLEYPLSEAFYQETVSHITGRDFHTTLCIVYQTKPPFAVALVIYPGELIEVGKYRANMAKDVISRCQDKNYYPGYEIFGEDGVIPYSWPKWYGMELPPVEI